MSRIMAPPAALMTLTQDSDDPYRCTHQQVRHISKMQRGALPVIYLVATAQAQFHACKQCLTWSEITAHGDRKNGFKFEPLLSGYE